MFSPFFTDTQDVNLYWYKKIVQILCRSHLLGSSHHQDVLVAKITRVHWGLVMRSRSSTTKIFITGVQISGYVYCFSPNRIYLFILNFL